MINLMNIAQQDDKQKKMMCESQIAQESDKQDELDNAVKNADAEIENVQDQINVLAGEIETLRTVIKTLDAQVAQATSMRQAENAAFQESIASNNAAIELLGMAKSRLDKFYNPHLYETSADPLPSNELQLGADALVESSDRKEAESKPQVIEMIIQIQQDIGREVADAKISEQHDQADYEKFMTDAKAKHAADAMAITAKESVKAELQSKTNLMNDDKSQDAKSLAQVAKVLGNLHQDCDWFLQNFQMQQTARYGEIEAMKKAQAVLAGADYSLAQAKHKQTLNQADVV